MIFVYKINKNSVLRCFFAHRFAQRTGAHTLSLVVCAWILVHGTAERAIGVIDYGLSLASYKKIIKSSPGFHICGVK